MIDLESDESTVAQKDDIIRKVELRGGIPVIPETAWPKPRAIDGAAVGEPGYIILWDDDSRQRQPFFYCEYLLDEKDYHRLLEKAGQKNYLQQAGG